MREGPRILEFGARRPVWTPLVDRLHDWAGQYHSVESPERCLQLLRSGDWDLLLLGFPTPEVSIASLAIEALRIKPALPVVVLSSEADTQTAASFGRLGAAEFLCVPDSGTAAESAALSAVQRVCEQAVPSPARTEAPHSPLDELAGTSRVMQSVTEIIRLIAPRQSTALVTGPTGAGKELVARAIHGCSPRARGPLVAVNCGAIPAGLMEAELFGHVKGAFTGAVTSRPGRFEQAHGGTIFLDEVGETPMEMQAKLLRVLQERELQRVGSPETVRIDVRVVAATNRDLKRMVRNGEFREDLYYRLNVVPIALPSLAERAEDIPLLADRLLERVCERERVPRKRFGRETLERLQRRNWPGNVRQLENAVEKAVALSGRREVLYPSDFPAVPEPLIRAGSHPAPEIQLTQAGLDYDAVVGEFERGLLAQALALSDGNKKRAADLLGIKRTTFAARWKAVQEKHEAAQGA